ncbi:MAG TPA: TonB family protein [Bryobacteraceae bacterium]|jgi:TonB family protein|nr:TonB family protein [Bryobacteraceae bacterium]
MKSQAELVQENTGTPAPELNLLLEWEGSARPRLLRDGLGSLAAHVVLLVALFFVLRADQNRVFRPYRPIDMEELSRATPLVAPWPTRLTQKAPNVNKATKEINLESLLSRPEPARAGRQRFRAPVAAPAPGIPAPAIAEPPKIEASAKLPETPMGINTEIPPPQLPPADKPKLAFETPGSPTSLAPKGSSQTKIPIPDASVQQAIRSAVQGGAGGGQVVGDVDDAGPSDPFHPSPQKAHTSSKLELLSDPKGMDFRPYLIQVLAAVRRNWFAVIPESARFGRRGRVQVQFVIARNGSVPKLVISMPSGADALDRASVASISASNPFPPLPREFKGNEVRLQLSFMYNTN